MQSDWISKSKGSGTLEQRLGSSLGARGRAAPAGWSESCQESREQGSSAESYDIKIRWSHKVEAIGCWGDAGGHTAYPTLLLLILNVCS